MNYSTESYKLLLSFSSTKVEKLDFRKMMPPPNPNVSTAESVTPNNTANPDQRYLIHSSLVDYLAQVM